MTQPIRRRPLHPHVLAVMEEMQVDDPFEAVRTKTRSIIEQFHSTFGECPPFNMQAVASLRGLICSDDDQKFSADSEIAPEADGRVVLRVNKSRPMSRQRFSIGHEIGHTLFPEYELAVRCRKAVGRSWADPNDLLETLCDVAASEVMFPAPWFHDRVNSLSLSAEAIAVLADDFVGSREATVRRLVELHPDPLAAVFFSWKLKPKELQAIHSVKNQITMFPELAARAPVPMLRVDYAILNDAFVGSCGSHIPKDKSIPSDGPIHLASMSGSLQNGTFRLDFGTVAGTFSVHALPVFTPEEAVGPGGGCSVVAVLGPI